MVKPSSVEARPSSPFGWALVTTPTAVTVFPTRAESSPSPVFWMSGIGVAAPAPADSAWSPAPSAPCASSGLWGPSGLWAPSSAAPGASPSVLRASCPFCPFCALASSSSRAALSAPTGVVAALSAPTAVGAARPAPGPPTGATPGAAAAGAPIGATPACSAPATACAAVGSPMSESEASAASAVRFLLCRMRSVPLVRVPRRRDRLCVDRQRQSQRLQTVSSTLTIVSTRALRAPAPMLHRTPCSASP